MMNLSINPIAPPLADKEAADAFAHLSKPMIYNQVVRTLADPAIPGQLISLFSFIPHGDAKPAPNGRFGYLKIRGNFGSELDAKHHAYNLVKNYDSFNEIYHSRAGVFVPLGPNMAKMINSIDEVNLNNEMTESLSQKIDEKRREDATKIAEIQEQAKKLKEEETQTTDDPETQYIQKRVKYATLKMTYLEHEKKMAEIVPILKRTRTEINKIDIDTPSFKENFFSKYMEAYKRAGLDQQNPNEMSEAFLRYLKEDIVLPFEKKTILEPVKEQDDDTDTLTEEPVTEEAVTEEPVTEEAVTEEPVTEEPEEGGCSGSNCALNFTKKKKTCDIN